MGISINKLTELSIRSLTVGKHFDGGGLYLLVKGTQPSSRLWRMKYRYGGKEKLLAIGKYPEISVKEARLARDEAKRNLRDGIDPSQSKVTAKKILADEISNSVKACTYRWIEKMSSGWGDKTRHTTESLFLRDVFPYIGGKPITQVGTLDILSIVLRVEKRGANFQAKRLLMKLGAFFRWAIVNQLVKDNPIISLRGAEIFKGYKVTHRAALSSNAIGQFLKDLEGFSGERIVRLAVEFLMHTALRPGEVRHIRWEDIDFDKGTITIPAENMKMRRAHVVPLTERALALLRDAQILNSRRTFVFASPVKPSQPLSENTLNLVVKKLGNGATSHGMRATFSTIAHESLNWSTEVIEAALSHQDNNRIRAAYARTDYLEQRIKLMHWWSNYLSSKKMQAGLALIKQAC
jgi:integrase